MHKQPTILPRKQKNTTFALANHNTAIKTVSYIVRLLVVLALGLYLGLLLFTVTPACQRWLAAKASDVLSEELQTEVRIGHVRIGLFNRVVLDDIFLADQSGDTLLRAARLSTKLDVWQLTQGRIRIANAQLFGYDIRLRRASMETPYNFQFLIDHFAAEDTTSTPLDLAVNSIIIRRGTLSHHIENAPATDHFTPFHIELQDLSLRASIKTLCNDSISASISRLSFLESCSGLKVDDIQASLRGTSQEMLLSRFLLKLPHTELHIPEFTLRGGITAWQRNTGILQMQGIVTPSDFAPLHPLFSSFREPLEVHLRTTKQTEHITLRPFTLQGDGISLVTSAQGDLLTHDSLNGFPMESLRMELQRLQLQKKFYAPVLQALAQAGQPLAGQEEIAATLARLGDIAAAGHITATQQAAQIQGELTAQTSIGSLKAQGSLQQRDRFTLHAETRSFLLASLLKEQSDFPIDDITLTADAQGSLRRKLVAGATTLKGLRVAGTQLDHVETHFDLSPRTLTVALQLIDNEYNIRLSTDLRSAHDFRADVSALEEVEGHIGLERVRVHRKGADYELNQLHLSTTNDERGHHLLVSGDFIDAHADGKFRYASIVPTVQYLLHQSLPSLIPLPEPGSVAPDDQMTFSVHMWNTTPLLNLAGIDLRLPEPGYVEGSLDVPAGELSVMADFPHLIYGSEEFRAVSMLARQERDSLTSFVTLQRMMEAGPMDLSVLAEGGHDLLHTTAAWDDHNDPAQRGELTTVASFFKDEQARLGAEIHVRPTSIVVSDTIWNVHNADIRYQNGAIAINGFQISQLGRHLRVDGHISSNPADTLYADLRGINLQYIFGIIDFHDVEFEGYATGGVKIHDIYEDITVDADLRVDQLKLNGGLLGEGHVIGGFGRKDERAIDLDILIREPVRGELSRVAGIVKPGHEPGRGLDLDIQARYLNIYFINFFAKDILDDLQGHTTGHAHLYGPFKQLDLEGALALDTVAVGIGVIGTRYHTHGGDSIFLFPGGIRFADIQLYDRHHGTDIRQHNATLNGELRFEHFKNLRYAFDVAAHDFLGYDFHDFGDQSFFGTVFADGNVHLAGRPGQLTIDIQCRPTQGTVFTYNASGPETLIDNGFITYTSSAETSASPETYRESSTSRASDSSNLSDYPEDSNSSDNPAEDEPTDMHINFDLDITPQTQLRLLMDARSEDYITLFGDAHIRANFYNKGRFQMYGTYRVDHGTYRLSLQDVIRKEFRFQQGSTIVFGGDPMQGDLNLQAIYTVPSVSLNDLAVGNNFSSSNVRVNCLMNIGGRAEQPQVSFDFDIPNVNEDEKQMVRSLISTEEERNMQVIYLLGIGRFYTQDLGAGQSQTNAAMQSLLSSTISGQLNDILSNAIGNSNWNIGTNLSTGTQGWNEVDVEGMLSGRLLNNRLLINGTFGYRDTPIANTNFIGDFDVQYLITPSGTVSLKAYSETNDRYFTKTALTTQGIGIQVKKDFNSLRELFRLRRKKH